MDFIVIAVLTIIVLLWVFKKDRVRTVKSLKIAGNLFKKTFMEILTIMALIALLLAWVPQSMIKSLLGNSSEIISILVGAIFGTVTIIPAFVAFPLAGTLLKNGAQIVAITAFITTLTMVGLATMPVEIKYFGKKFTLVRNGLSFVIAILIALGMGLIL